MSPRPIVLAARHHASGQLARRGLATSTISTSASKEHQTLKLVDGRVLGFAEYGDPSGHPLLFFHGFPSSRIEARPAHQMAMRRGIRLLSLDRPGYGLSTPQPGRTMLDWASDVRAFAADQNLQRFAIMGGSGGGPYALACAYALPRSMVQGVGLFASAPHWAAGVHLVSRSRRALRFMANRWPSGLRASLEAVVGGAQWLVSTKRGAGWMDQVLKQASDKARAQGVEEPRDEKTPAQKREEVLQFVVKEPFAQGAGAAVEEARLLSADDWGFRLEDVDYDPVHIWHGVNDTNAPITMMRYMADKVPNAVLHELEGDTHYTMTRHLEAALGELVPKDTN